MRILLFLLSFSVYAEHHVFHTTENIMVLPIIEIIDGDTIRGSLSLPVPLTKISIRVANIDTPESTWRAKCDEEKLLGLEAKEYLKNKFKNSNIMILRNFKYGTYAGRIISEVFIDDINIGNLMIEKGYARLYDGRNKSNWCIK